MLGTGQAAESSAITMAPRRPVGRHEPESRTEWRPSAADTHWVAATIDPRDPNLFEFSPRIVPGNVNDR